MSGHHSEKEDSILSQEMEDKSPQRLWVDHFVSLDSCQVFSNKVELPAWNNWDVDPVEQGAKGGSSQKEVPEPQE